MKRAVRTVLLAVVLVGVIGLALPWLDTALYAMRLAAAPAPQALSMPVATLGRHALADTWHAHRAPARRHEGIDIFAKRGTPVIASTEGIVLSLGQNKLGGNVVWVLGPGGQRHYYAHLDRFGYVDRGQRVKPGDVIGYVGHIRHRQVTLVFP